MSVQMIKNNINSQSGGRRTPLSLSGGGAQATSKNSPKHSDETNVELTKTNVSNTAAVSKTDNITTGKNDLEEKKTETPTSPGKSGKAVSKANLVTENNGAKDVSEKKLGEASKKSERVKKQKNEIDSEKHSKTSNGNKAVDEKVNEIKNDKVIPPKSKKDNLSQTEQKDSSKVATTDGVKIEENREPEPKIDEANPKKDDKKANLVDKKKKVEESSPKPIMCKDSQKETKVNDDSIVEMEPLLFEKDDFQIGVCSTPGKSLQSNVEKTVSDDKPFEDIEKPTSIDASLPDRSFYPPATYRSITGRRSVRPMQDYNFSTNSFRESYRKINTELDVTNTSLNVTVGSEIPNCSTFSFFERSRKRERTPTNSEADAIDEVGSSPKTPKRARLDFSGFFGLVASPMTMLRSRFSRTKIQSTPSKLDVPNQNEDINVADFSGIAIEEETNMESDTTQNDNEILINGNENNSAEKKDTVEKPTGESDQNIIPIDAVENVQDTNIENSDIKIKIVNFETVDGEKLNGKETNNEKRRVCTIM